MSEKQKSKNLCKVCLASDEGLSQARECPQEHYHKGCGARVSARGKKFSCGKKHHSDTIGSYIASSKEVALSVKYRW